MRWFVGDIPITAVDFIIKRRGGKTEVYKLRASERGTLFIYPENTRSPKKRVLSFYESTLRVPVEVNVDEHCYRRCWRLKIYEKVKLELAKLLRELTRIEAVKEMAKNNIWVMATVRGSVHAKVWLTEESAAPLLLMAQRMKGSSELLSYGHRSLFDLDVKEEKLKEHVREMLKRTNLNFPENIEKIVEILRRENVKEDEISKALERIVKILDEISKQDENPIVRELARISHKQLKDKTVRQGI